MARAYVKQKVKVTSDLDGYRRLPDGEAGKSEWMAMWDKLDHCYMGTPGGRIVREDIVLRRQVGRDRVNRPEWVGRPMWTAGEWWAQFSRWGVYVKG